MTGDPERYGGRLRRRHALGRVLQFAGALLVVAMLLAWRGWRLFDGLGRPEPRPPAIVVRVAAEGELRIDGCADSVDACARAAFEREQQRPGGGSYECRVVEEPGAAREASGRAVGACLRNGLQPSVLPAPDR